MSGMAEVLAGHFMVGLAYTEDQATSFDICKCGERANDIEDHQAAMLTAAGFGPVKEAGAVALEEAADVLKPSGVLWWGGEGVYVAEERHAPPSGTLDAWLRARAAKLRASIA